MRRDWEFLRLLLGAIVFAVSMFGCRHRIRGLDDHARVVLRPRARCRTAPAT